MAKCLNCGKAGKSRKAKNWQKWQLCYKCALKLHGEEYLYEKPHGTGYRYPKEARYQDFGTIEMPLITTLKDN